MNNSIRNLKQARGNFIFPIYVFAWVSHVITLVVLSYTNSPGIYDLATPDGKMWFALFFIIPSVFLTSISTNMKKQIELHQNKILLVSVFGKNKTILGETIKEIRYSGWNQSGFTIHFRDGSKQFMDTQGIYALDQSWVVPRLSEHLRKIPFSTKAHIIGFNIANAFNVPFGSKHLLKSELSEEKQ